MNEPAGLSLINTDVPYDIKHQTENNLYGLYFYEGRSQCSSHDQVY